MQDDSRPIRYIQSTQSKTLYLCTINYTHRKKILSANYAISKRLIKEHLSET